MCPFPLSHTHTHTHTQVMPELIPSVSAIVAGLKLSLVNLSLSGLVTFTSSSSLALIRVVQAEFGASLVLGLLRRGQKLAESMKDQPNQVHEEWCVTLLPVFNDG